MKWRLIKNTDIQPGSILGLIIASAALLFSGCIIGYDADGVPLGGGTCAVNGVPEIHLVSPTPGQEIFCGGPGSCPELRVVIETENLCLEENWGQPNVTGEAHIKVFIDGQPLKHPQSGLETLAIDNLIVPIVSLNDGPHNVEVVTYNNDGTPHSVLGPISVEWHKFTDDGLTEEGAP